MDLRSILDPGAWLEDLYARRGVAQYGGERVSQLEHVRQCATLAEQEGPPTSLAAAALLHDVGHLIRKEGDDPAAGGVADRHETVGANVLSRWFAEALVEPIRLHVPAKRYLCAVDASYPGQLSPASQRRLAL